MYYNPINKIILITLFFITISCANISFAQEIQNPEDIAAVNDAFENNFYDALTQKALENHDKAVVSLQKCLETVTTNPAIYNELGKNYLALKKYAEAQNAFQKAVDLNPKERWYWNGLYDVFYETKDYNNAITTVLRLIDFNPNFQDDLVSLYMYTQQKDKALALLKKMEQTTNLSEKMEFYKLQLEKTPEVNKPKKQDLEESIKKNPLVEQNYIDLIYQYAASNNEEKAFEIAKLLAENIPTSDWAHVSLAKFYLNNNDGTNAVNSVFKVLESLKIDIKIKHRVFNEFLLFAATHETFMEPLKKASIILEQDKTINVNSEVGKFFLKKQRTNEALYFFEKSWKQKPEDFESFEFLMQLLAQKKDFEKTILFAQEQLELYPTQANLYYYLGNAFLNLNKTNEAILKLEEGLDYVIENPDLEKQFCRVLIEAFEKTGNTKKRDYYIEKQRKLKN